MAWSLVLTDLNYNPVGEILNAKERTINLGLSRVETCSFKVRMDNQLMPDLEGCEGYVKAYRDGALQFFGPIVKTEEVADSNTQSLAVNCASPAWFLSKRMYGTWMPSGLPVNFAPNDRALLASVVINDINSQKGNTGIDWNTGNVSAGGLTPSPFYAIDYGTKALDVIQALANTFDGFEWRMTPQEPAVVTGQAWTGYYIAKFNAVPHWGVTQENAIFEYGPERGNVQGYSRTRDRETQLNRAYHMKSGQAQDAALTYTDADSVAKWGVMEDFTPLDNVDNFPDLRSAWVKANVDARKNPREQIQFTPHIDPQRTGRLPNFSSDYDIGDTIRVRSTFRVDGEEITRFDRYMRLYSIQFQLDDTSGTERLTFTTIDDGTT